MNKMSHEEVREELTINGVKLKHMALEDLNVELGQARSLIAPSTLRAIEEELRWRANNVAT